MVFIIRVYMITYEGLYKQLSKQGHNKYWLRKNGISPSVLDKLGKGGGLDYRSINKLCALLNCQPGDLMEYVPDAVPDGNAEENA